MNGNIVRLDESEVPKRFYNIVPDLSKPLPPPLNPKTREPINPKDLEVIFPKEIIRQEGSKERYIKIPREVREAYLRIGRPTPLYRAIALEKYLKTPARIYYKREDVSFTGSHKTNTALAQAYYAKKEGFEKLTTETGAGQWGSALSLGTMFFGLDCLVFMVRCSYEQKPGRKIIMKTYGADIFPSPSDKTEFGRKLLEKNPKHPGSLGIAISEAIETAIRNKDTCYSLGSVLNHVLMHQTVIGQEVIRQFEILDEVPDILIGCVGGGSNFSGFCLPYVGKVLRKEIEKDIEFLAVEPKAVPTLTKGTYEYDFGDTAELTPLLKMDTLGHAFIPPPIHAGGLRYHGDAPILCLLKKEGIIKARPYEQKEIFEAARIFARTEGILPAPETSHAVKAAIDEAINAKRERERKIIAFNFSGHGLLDLKGYEEILRL
jgi:tryptophan synthase beta chain